MRRFASMWYQRNLPHPQLSIRNGGQVNTATITKMIEMFQKDNDSMGMAAVLQGHQYYRGDGKPQSYEEAAKYYSIAATKGNVEGMYNLVL
jgi:TPR repeat protein